MTQKTALVVDDSPTMRQMIKVTMDAMGFDCMSAQDGEKALTILGERTVDIIVTDINMPNMDGIQLIKELRASNNAKFTPILVITTEGGDNTKQAGKAAGASGWIVKPFKPETLEAAVTKLCKL
ncbi:MAG TPA: response regulator [Alphaproteobacteria bacterium]|nr:response regulator [Alphaproteobacteria bacterium]